MQAEIVQHIHSTLVTHAPQKCTNCDGVGKVIGGKDSPAIKCPTCKGKGIFPFNENGERLFLEGEALNISRKQQKMRLGTDEVMEDAIYKYLLSKNETTMREILIDCFKYTEKDLTGKSQTAIVGRILKKLGFERKERKASDGSSFKYVREVIVPVLDEEELYQTPVLEVWDE